MSDLKSDHDLLIEIRQDMKHLKSEFEKISNGVGFPRCATRAEEIRTLKDRQLETADALKWVKRSIFGLPAAYVIIEIIKKYA